MHAFIMALFVQSITSSAN